MMSWYYIPDMLPSSMLSWYYLHDLSQCCHDIIYLICPQCCHDIIYLICSQCCHDIIDLICPQCCHDIIGLICPQYCYCKNNKPYVKVKWTETCDWTTRHWWALGTLKNPLWFTNHNFKTESKNLFLFSNIWSINVSEWLCMNNRHTFWTFF